MKIKKLVAVLFALCLAVGVMALSASASEIVASGTCGADGDNLTWTLDDEGTLTISGEGEMAGYACKQWNMYDIYSVIINEGVTSIGSHAFYECYELTDISIPLGVLKIGSGAFYCCTKLTEIELPDTVTRIDDSAFSLCRKINDLVIPNSVNKIGIYSFSGCKSLEKIIFVGAAPTIGSYAFENVTASIYYSADDASWTEDVRLNYGGSLMWLPVSKPHITAQPEIIYARYGESAEVSVKVDGVAITYQWYISADGENFTKASGNGDTYS
ncbi:MAG: leucine-rich repeat domain-containing protein, partial [Clostridia bacterium]|nr:leucine-rich repeat domain-containing protein [Clostridia bacterium]